MSALADKLPAQLARAAQSSQMDEKQLRRVEGIINSMTPAETDAAGNPQGFRVKSVSPRARAYRCRK